MKNSQKGFVVPVILVVIALFVVGGGVYVYSNKKAEAPAVIDTGAQPANDSQSINVEKYQDTENGFQFNFPSNWKVVQHKVGLENVKVSTIQSPDFNQVVHEAEESYTELKQGAEISVYVQTSPSAKTIKDLQDFNKLGRGGPVFVNERIIKVDGKDVLRYDYTGYGGSLGHHLELLTKNSWIRIDIRYGN